MNQVKTTCPYCGVGCGVLASLNTEGQVSISGDPEHPANFGRLCSKGAALADTISCDGRLLYPEVNGETENWPNALNYVADKFSAAIRQHGPESVAFYVSGQLLTEDYYVANKLMKGFIGSGNIDTNSRLCMSSAVAGYKRAFGADSVPCSYEDLELAELVILTGSNLAWCHPVLFQRIKAAKENNPTLKVIVIDPRVTATCDIADLHLAINPSSDMELFNGLLVYLKENGFHNKEYISAHTEGFDDALDVAKQYAENLQVIADKCGVEIKLLEKFYQLFATTEKTVTAFSQGINQSSFGTDRVNAIINCHLSTAKIGKPGAGPFSITGQPNAMGGREVGGLSNQLAAHMAIENPQHQILVQEFWQSPYIANSEGKKAVDLFQAVHDGKIKALWIMATNPAVSMPDSLFVQKALENCEFVVVSDCVRTTDTTAYADVLLPSQTWGERDGTVTNSERRISRQRGFLPVPGDAKADWWIITEVARRMGFADKFQYQEAADVFKEHAQLSAYKNNGLRDFDLSQLKGMTYEQYDDMEPVQWPVTSEFPNGTERLFSDAKFYTENQKAKFIAVADKQPVSKLSAAYPLILNTGRIRDQWHSMTRTGKSSTLSAHTIEPYIEIHADDAKKYAVNNKDLAIVASEKSEIIVRVKVSDSQRRGSVFIPIHWNKQFASSALVDELVTSNVDPISGQPEFKYTAVNVKAYQPKWCGFLLSRRKLEIKQANYWSVAKGLGLWRYELAGDESQEDWAESARNLLCKSAEDVNWIEYLDKAEQRYRAARIEQGRLESCIFIAPNNDLPERDWLVQLFAAEKLQEDDRISLLTAKPKNKTDDAGKIVCACFSVGINTIKNAIASASADQNTLSLEAIGQQLKAGTNCGSCVPEIRKILRDANRKKK